MLGLSPLPLAPYLAGTATGMAFWSVFYASLGGASRSLLRRGVAPDVLIADLLAKVGAASAAVACFLTFTAHWGGGGSSFAAESLRYSLSHKRAAPPLS